MGQWPKNRGGEVIGFERAEWVRKIIDREWCRNTRAYVIHIYNFFLMIRCKIKIRISYDF